jgi:NTE family protein
MGSVGVVLRAAGWACALALGACASIHNEPVNVPLTANASVQPVARAPANAPPDDDFLLTLSFSGGGTRAAAFAHGVLLEMDSAKVPGAGPPSFLSRLNFLSGVSGGSVIAAYYGLKKQAALSDFRERFLLRDVEASLRTNVNIVNLVRALDGGINDATGLTRWLDQNLFEGATFADFNTGRGPRIWINASDIYNRTPFLFGDTAFAAMCSDINAYPVADAVAASAAVPVVFAPVVIKTYPGGCNIPLPPWIERARKDRNAVPMLKSFASAIGRYHDGSMPYVKLMDGALVDNYGLSGFTIARLSSKTPYEPLTPRQAVKLRRVVTLVVDAGRGPSGKWIDTVAGPSGKDLFVAAADTATEASVSAGYTAFDRVMMEWQSALVRWRCNLSPAERERLGAGPGWNCGNLKFFVTRIGFDHLDAARLAQVNEVPTRFSLPAEQVDTVIEAGREALRANAVYKAFLKSL